MKCVFLACILVVSMVMFVVTHGVCCIVCCVYDVWCVFVKCDVVCSVCGVV